MQTCVWDIPDSKSPPPAQLFRALGAMIDFTDYPCAAMCIQPAEDRISELLEVLKRILSDRALSPALAGKIYGKLMFLSSSMLGDLAVLYSEPLHEDSMSSIGLDSSHR